MRPSPVTTISPSPFAASSATAGTPPLGTPIALTPTHSPDAFGTQTQAASATPSGSAYDTILLLPDVSRVTLPDKTTDPIAGNVGSRATHPPLSPMVPGVTVDMMPGVASGTANVPGSLVSAATGGVAHGGVAHGGIAQGGVAQGGMAQGGILQDTASGVGGGGAGSETRRIAVPLLLGGAMVLIGIMVMRGSGPPAPVSSNAAGGPTSANTSIPATPSASPSASASQPGDDPNGGAFVSPPVGNAPGPASGRHRRCKPKSKRNKRGL